MGINGMQWVISICGVMGLVLPLWAGEPVDLDEYIKGLPRYDVSGQVVDVNGTPVEGAGVWLYYARGEDGLRDRGVGQVQTDREGRFVFSQAVVWEPRTEDKAEDHDPHYSVIAYHPDLGLYFANLFEGDALDQVKITLHPQKTKTIEVREPNGTPIAGATVFMCGGRLKEEDREGLDRKYTYLRINQDLGIVSEVTDEQGKATVLRLDNGYCMVTKPGYKRTWVPSGTAIMFRGASVSGTVSYPDGTPAAGAAVWFDYDGERLVWSDVTIADANGHYCFDHVPASSFYYSWMNPEDEAGAKGTAGVKADDLRVGSSLLCKKETFSIDPGDQIKQDLTFADSVTLSGQVIDIATDKPAARMEMRLLVRTGMGYLDTKDVQVADDGRFSVQVAPGSEVSFSWEESRREGDYLIDESWRSQGNYNPSFRQVVHENVNDLVFRVKLVPLQPLTGRVVDEQGNAVPKAKVHIHSDLPYATADESGVFNFKGVFAQQDFDLFAESSDESLAGIVSVPKGESEATITLHPSRDYQGKVTGTGTDGMPARDLKFYLDLKLNDSTLYRVRREPKTDDDGKFKVKQLCLAAHYYAWWSSDNDENRDYDYGNADIDLSHLSDEGLITFQAKQYLSVIMGTVRNEQGEPIAGAQIGIRSYNLVQQNERDRAIVTDESGDFEIPRLAPGQVSLRIFAEGYVAKQFQVPTDTFDFEAVLSKDTGLRHYRVTVTDGHEPLVGVTLQSWLNQIKKSGPSDSFAVYNEYQTDEKGLAEFDLQLDEEHYRYQRLIVGCDLPGYDLGYLGFQLNEEIDAVLVLHPSDGLHWKILVQDAKTGEPIPDATARILRMQVNGGLQGASFRLVEELENDYVWSADSKGSIHLDRLSTKDIFNLEVSAPGHAKVGHWLSFRQPERTTVQLPLAGRLSGRVVFKDGALPQGLKVYPRLLSGNGSSSPITVDTNGVFVNDRLSPGNYNVRLLLSAEQHKQGLVCLSLDDVTLTEGKTTEIVLEIERGTLVSGTLVDKATGQALKGLEGAYVMVNRGNVSHAVDPNGAWSLYLPAGEMEIQYRLQNQPWQVFKIVTVTQGQSQEGLAIEVDASNQDS